MKLPIPIFFKDKVYREIEIIKPKGSIIADTKKLVDKGDLFSAMRIFIIGCTESIDEVTDKVNIKSLISKMPWKSAEYIAISIMLLYYPEDDGIEGVYPCPRCGLQYISEFIDNEGIEIDTRDFISQLQINYWEQEISYFPVELSDPVIILNKASGDILFQVSEIEINFPTIENCINAYLKLGDLDEIRLQYQMFVEALKTVNGESIDNKWKATYGLFFFENIKEVKIDIGKITETINSCGIDPRVKKNCKNCGKIWQPQISTSNFFVSGLHV